MGLLFGLTQNNRRRKETKPLRRKLGIESLESRELLSATLADLPQPEFSPSMTAGVASISAASTTVAQTKLLAPRSVSKGIDVTPTTLTVRWSPPTATNGITGYEVTLQNTLTKAIVASKIVNHNDVLSCSFEGLDVKNRYEISITSLGDPATTDNSKATLKLTATTAAFPVVTAKVMAPGITSTEILITDKDKVLPLVNGKTVKTYTVQYAPKATTINWDTAPTVAVPAGSAADMAKGTVSCVIEGLLPGTNYTFRVTATYVEGTGASAKTLTSTTKDMAFKTTALPIPTLSKSAFTITEGELGLFVSVRQTSPALFQTGTVKYSLYVSTSTASSTTLLPGALPIGEEKIDTAATFDMKPISLKTIAQLFGDSSSGDPTLLGLTTISFQVAVEYTDNNGVVAQVYSRPLKVSLPKWYVPA